MSLRSARKRPASSLAKPSSAGARWLRTTTSAPNESRMNAARLCIVRHGETEWNAARRIQGQLDVPLSNVGRAQARCVSEALPEGRFGALYSSDLARVLQTAAPAAERLGLVPRVDARLRE